TDVATLAQLARGRHTLLNATWLDPEGLPFERIARHRDAIAQLAIVKGGPIQLDADSPQTTQGRERVFEVARCLLRMTHGVEGMPSGLVLRARQHAQGAAWTDFEQHALTGLEHGCDAI